MKETILALLIAKFSGERKDGLTQLAGSLALQAETKEEAQALVEKLTQPKVTDFIKDWRSGVDKEITTATKTAEEKLKEKFDFVEKGKSDPDPATEPPKGDDDIDAKIQAAVQAAVTPLTQKLQGYEDNERITARQTFISNTAKELQLPDWRIAEGFSFTDTDDESAIKQKLTAIKQNLITAGLEKQELGALQIASTGEEQAKELAKSWAQGLPDM